MKNESILSGATLFNELADADDWKSLSPKLSNSPIEDPLESDIEKREVARRMRQVQAAREKYNSQFISQYLKKAIEKVESPPPATGVYINPQNLLFHVKHFVDIRWGKFRWQSSMAREGEINKITKRRFAVSVKKYPRRHGKTHYDVHDGRDYLLSVPSAYPVGAYYCPVRDQSIRNAWRVFERALAPLPGHIIHKSKSYMTFPKPTVANPDNYITIYFFGVVGGTASKRGSYLDWGYFDEMEFIDIDFIHEAGITSAFDRGGIVRLTGTPYGMGRIQYWLDEAKKRETIRKAIANKSLSKGYKIPEDVNEWVSYSENCWSLKVYPKKWLDAYKAKVPPHIFQQEMECIDSLEIQGYYHRAAIESLTKAGGINPFVRMDPNLPLRCYFDLGIGMKTDRMAFLICQFGPGFIKILYARTVFQKGYAAAIAKLRESPYVRHGIFEIVLPHDGKNSEQSDGIPRVEKFRAEVRKQGLATTSVRYMQKTSDKLMDINTTTELIPFMQIHEIDAMELVEAAKGHRKRFLQKEKIFVQEPAKTKYTDMADALRGMCIDLKYNTYTKAVRSRVGFIDPTLNIKPELEGVRKGDSVNVGYHPSENSIIIRNENMDASLLDGVYVQPTQTRWTI